MILAQQGWHLTQFEALIKGMTQPLPLLINCTNHWIAELM